MIKTQEDRAIKGSSVISWEDGQNEAKEKEPLLNKGTLELLLNPVNLNILLTRSFFKSSNAAYLCYSQMIAPDIEMHSDLSSAYKGGLHIELDHISIQALNNN